MKIKLCGFKEEKSLEAAISAKVDFIGFIFYESSPRNVTINQAKKLANLVPQNIAKTCVTVNASIEELQEINDALNPQYFQLHGSESLAYVKNIKKIFPKVKIIKAFGVSQKEDLLQINPYENLVDNILIDNKNPGSGKTFDWSFIKDFKFKNDWLLSGGLNKDNIIDAVNKTNAPMIDISSGIEKIKGEKSIDLINEITKIFTKLK